MEPTLSSETSAFILQTPGKFPKEHRLHSKHGESLKTTVQTGCLVSITAVSTCRVHEFDFHATMQRDKFLIIQPNRFTDFSDLFLE